MFSAAELVLFSGPPACPEAPVTARVFKVEEVSNGERMYTLLLGGRCRGQVVKAAEPDMAVRRSSLPGGL